MDKKPKYTVIDGLRCPPSFVPEVLRDAINYRPGKGEVVVATYPKCGTTWALQIVVLILRKGRPPATTDDYFRCMPFLEITPIKQIKQMSKPGCIKTHLPFNLINYSPDAKYIYVARHPADCVVSYYHHTRYFPVYQFSDGSFETFFDLFIGDGVDFNDYFDHLLSWYEKRNLSNVLFLTYESIKKDHKGAILKIAKFLDGGKLAAKDDSLPASSNDSLLASSSESLLNELLANDESLLNDVLHYTSLDYMKSAVNGFWQEVFTAPPPIEIQEQSPVMKKYAGLLEEANSKGYVTKGQFIRNGEVGEGKIALSVEQMDRLNARIREKTAHSDVMDLWENI